MNPGTVLHDALKRPALWVGIWVVVVQAAIVFVRGFPGPGPVPKDFAQYYAGAMVVARGEAAEALYFVDLVTGLTTQRFPESRFGRIAAEAGIVDTSYFIYPPWVGGLYLPLVLLSPYGAFAAVYVLNWLMVAAAFVLLARSLPSGGGAAAVAVFVPFSLSPAFAKAMGSGQASVGMLLLLVLFSRDVWRGRWLGAGAWWAVMTGLKLFPVLLVPFALLFRRWRLLLAYGAFGAAIALISLAVAGFDAHRRFLELTMEYARYCTTTVSNQSMVGFIARFLDPESSRSWSIHPIPAAASWIFRAAQAVLLAAAALAARRAVRTHGSWGPPLALCLFVLWTFTAAANIWIHHLIALAVPMMVAAAYLLSGASDRPVAAWILWAGAWGGFLLPEAYGRLPVEGVWEAPLLLNFLASGPFLATLLLWALLLTLAWRAPSGEPQEDGAVPA